MYVNPNNTKYIFHWSDTANGSCKEGYTLSFDSPDCINVNKCTTGQTVLLVTLIVFYWFAIITTVFIIMKLLSGWDWIFLCCYALYSGGSRWVSVVSTETPFKS